MKKHKSNQKTTGVYYFNKRVLKFRNNHEDIDDNDIMNLFVGFLRLLNNSIEQKLDKKYKQKILVLQREIEYLRQIKNVN